MLFCSIDPFANGGATPDIGSRGYSDIMREQQLRKEEADLKRQMVDRAKEGSLKVISTFL
jgi:splicing factor 3B subunit 1